MDTEQKIINQTIFFINIINDIAKTKNIEEKHIKTEILHQLLQDYNHRNPVTNIL